MKRRRQRKPRQKSRPKLKLKLKLKELGLEELNAIVERTQSGPLSEEDRGKLEAAVETLAFLTRELEAKGTSIKRLRKLLFGASTEKTSRVVGKARDDAEAGTSEPVAPGAGAGVGTGGVDEGTDGASAAKADEKRKRKGHGRNGAAAYTGAHKVRVTHASLERGAHCPGCQKGKVYPHSQPAVLVRVTGMAPLSATVYELEKLRCNLCGEIFTAPSPAGVGDQKYDETAAAMIGMLKYGCGLPFNRLEKLQRGLGLPLPAATQWELVERAAGLLAPAHEELVRQAAQGDVLYNDDTTMKVLELTKEIQEQAASDEKSDERTGVFTSGIVATGDGHRIALFFTGRKHAGENLEDVLAQRAEELGAPIQMVDMLSWNTAGDFETVLAACNSHARRRYVDVADNFPDECRHVLEELGKVYKNDAVTREREMSPEQRLSFHQTESGPLMEKLERWLEEQLDERKVEPNSGLGEAIEYMLEHWDKLTLFLRVPGAPLDNNICERILKKAILHRKNSYFFKTKNGARVGDLFMSLIHTAELHGVDAFDYLVELQRHWEDVALHPSDWMPWNYRETLAALTSGPDPPS